MKIVCKNCGATISSKVHKCPYCGGINYIGARKKYFKDLNKIKDNLEDLDDIPVEKFKKETSTQVKRIIKIIIISSIIIGLIYGVTTLISRWKDKQYDDFNMAQPKDQLMWERNNFPKLNEWYEAGKYDKLIKYRDDLYFEDPIYTFNNWEHVDFLYVYENYINAMEAKEIIDGKDELLASYVASAIYAGLDICYNLKNKGLDNDEIERLEVYKADMEALLFDTLRFTEEEALKLYEEASDGGFLNFIKINDFATKYIKLLD